MPGRKTAIRTKIYRQFRGVDFSTDPALVDDSRSPWAVNLVSDTGGAPEKRPGWETLLQLPVGTGGEQSRITGIHVLEQSSGERFMLVYCKIDVQGTSVGLKYSIDMASWQAQPHVGTPPSDAQTSVVFDDKLFVFDGTLAVAMDGHTIKRLDDASAAHIPLTLISCAPSGGGTPYEAVNLISAKQCIGFLSDGTSAEYTLPYAGLESVGPVTVNGEQKTEGTDYTVNLPAGTVTFLPGHIPPVPAVDGEDNVFITLERKAADVAAAKSKIMTCTTATVWGVNGASDRIFCAGNSTEPGLEYWCDYNNPFYWPDTNYAVVGAPKIPILGYRRLGDKLAVLKKDFGAESTMYIQSGTLSTSGDAIFTVLPALTGVGAANVHSFGSIGDEQLVLTHTGVYGLVTNLLTAERTAQHRSTRVDPLMIRDELAAAVCASYDECFLIFCGGHVYGLDGRRQKAYASRYDTDYVYEAFYWDNVPATCAAVVKANTAELESGTTDKDWLYFGTADGRICRFKTATVGVSKFSDDDAPINAVWSTKADDDGDPMVLKTMLKKGNAVTIKPYARSSAKICFRTDRDAADWQAAYGTMDIFNWDDIDFSRFTFSSNDAPQEVPFNRKVKNYKRLQIIIKNDTANEGFGIYEITKHFVAGNFSKK